MLALSGRKRWSVHDRFHQVVVDTSSCTFPDPRVAQLEELLRAAVARLREGLKRAGWSRPSLSRNKERGHVKRTPSRTY
jgi:hypothetical protein